MKCLAERITTLRQKQSGTSGRKLLPVELELERLTLGQLVEFLETCREKFLQAKIEPGKSTTNYL
jgi:hypothetical protein